MTIFEAALGGLVLGALGGFTLGVLVVGTFKKRPERDFGAEEPRPDARPIPHKTIQKHEVD